MQMQKLPNNVKQLSTLPLGHNYKKIHYNDTRYLF